MQILTEPLKTKLLKTYDEYKGTLEGSQFDTLNSLEQPNDTLYSIGQKLTQNYKNAHIMQETYSNICDILNEWLNKQKKYYSNNGIDCDKINLWDNYIEDLWKKLGEDNDRNHWCIRETTNYGCSISTSTHVVTVSFTLLFRTIKTWMYNKINRIKKIKEHLYNEDPEETLENSLKYQTSFSENGRININYHTSETS
ncbi:PIR Superfamily Protein [Plasmodium ovale curtisi]|uniref:PIR Superfamily Protein n=1 Tax=Plasmodium ovale curtisi TaxID=864141 RepID=A0A1A8WHE7_PLAOA|nr:PIR Superfamily Protein [Plasmodium ovale curtisi]